MVHLKLIVMLLTASMYSKTTQVFLILPLHLLESQWCSFDSYLVKVDYTKQQFTFCSVYSVLPTSIAPV